MRDFPLRARVAIISLILLLALLTLSQWAAGDEVRSRTKQSPGEMLYLKGVAALAQGNVNAAENNFKESLRVDPQQAAPLIGLAEIALHRSQPEEAQRLLQTAISVAGDNAEAYAAWGRYLFHSAKQYGKAEQAFRRAIELNPRAASPWVELGDIYMLGLRRPDQAIEPYKTAVRLDPQNAAVHYALGNALAVKGDLQGAQSQYEEASRLEPDNPLPHLARGDVLAGMGKYADAISEFQSALRISPKLASTYTKIGMICQRDHRVADARRAYQTAIDLDPNQVIAYNNLAVLAAEEKTEMGQALTWAEKAVQLAPREPQVLDTLGWVYRARGELDKALDTLKAATSIGPPQPNILYHLGVVYAEKGRQREAREALARALALEKNFEGADDARSRLAEVRH